MVDTKIINLPVDLDALTDYIEASNEKDAQIAALRAEVETLEQENHRLDGEVCSAAAQLNAIRAEFAQAKEEIERLRTDDCDCYRTHDEFCFRIKKITYERGGQKEESK